MKIWLGESRIYSCKFPVGGKSDIELQKLSCAIPALLFCIVTLSACAAVSPAPSPRAPRESYPPPAYSSGRDVAADGERLRRVMVPLLRAMDHSCRSDQARVGIMNQSEINAANAGN